MSGRSGYRKTERRQIKGDPGLRTEIRLCFLLPSLLMLSTSPGPHGDGVEVMDGGPVTVTGANREQILARLSNFLLPIAHEKMLSPIPARLVSSQWPNHPEGFYIVVNSQVTLTRTPHAPAVFALQKTA